MDYVYPPLKISIWLIWLCLVDVINLSRTGSKFELAQVLQKKPTRCLMCTYKSHRSFYTNKIQNSNCPKSQDQKQIIQLENKTETP